MLWTVFVVLLILWLLGLSFHVGGSLINVLLVVALVTLIVNLISGRRVPGGDSGGDPMSDKRQIYDAKGNVIGYVDD